MVGKKYPIITKQMLQKNSKEECEFCDKTFKNRYDSLIHNATHIIIPLLKENFIQCSKCDYECVSQTDLHQHILVEHPLIIKTENLNLWDVEVENNEKTDQENGGQDIPINMKNQYGVSLLCNNDINNQISVLQNNIPDLIHHAENIKSEYDSSLNIKTEVLESSESIEKPLFKDRLLFENDEEVSDSESVEDTEPTMDKLLCLDRMPDDDDIDTPLIVFAQKNRIVPESHYESLTTPNTLFCRYCSAMFLSRFNLIVHEQKHIKFKQKIMGMLCLHCDKYIAGDFSNLSKHIDVNHARDKYKVYCTSLCKKCGLQYRSYKHHMYNYHSTKCCNINKFVTDNHFKNHLDKCLCHSHILAVCKMCHTELKEGGRYKCATLGMKRTRGLLQDCKKCDRKVQEIFKVKLSCKTSKLNQQHWYVQDRPLSNKDRLRNIRMRLKKLNILSKMYCFVLICEGNNSLF